MVRHANVESAQNCRCWCLHFCNHYQKFQFESVVHSFIHAFIHTFKAFIHNQQGAHIGQNLNSNAVLRFPHTSSSAKVVFFSGPFVSRFNTSVAHALKTSLRTSLQFPSHELSAASSSSQLLHVIVVIVVVIDVIASVVVIIVSSSSSPSSSSHR